MARSHISGLDKEEATQVKAHPAVREKWGEIGLRAALLKTKLPLDLDTDRLRKRSSNLSTCLGDAVKAALPEAALLSEITDACLSQHQLSLPWGAAIQFAFIL